MMSLRRLARMAKSDSGESDDAVLEAFRSYRGSYNADWAFQAILGATCAIGLRRPHLLDRLLPRAIDPCVCMGVVTLEGFWRYGDFCIDRALFETHPQAVPDFDEESAAFFRNDLRQRYEPLVARLLEERLAEPND
ncbi:MAG: hypothetical protein ABUT39_08215 [Acidobacteriota bacterium]